MWFETPPTATDWKPAERHLRQVDPRLGAIIDGVGPCTLAPRRDYFVVLCKAIFTQQISTAVATTLFGRFRDLFPLRRPTPPLVLDVIATREAEVLRHCGLSRQKAAYLKDLAEHFESGQIPTRRLARMSDEEVIDALVRVKGIGRWTAEMFLIFVLNRPDVFPVDDLGLRDGVRAVRNLPERPSVRDLHQHGEIWRPWRSVATWYLWRRTAAAPVSSTPAADGTPATAPRAAAGRGRTVSSPATTPRRMIKPPVAARPAAAPPSAATATRPSAAASVVTDTAPADTAPPAARARRRGASAVTASSSGRRKAQARSS